MTSCFPVAPSDIQKELDKLEKTHEENKQQRACLFNLVVYTFKSKQPDYYWQLADQLAKQFPCRILFIEENEQAEDPHLNTSLCIKLLTDHQEKKIICEQINIEVSSSRKEEIYPLLLPHIVPDLPIYLLWADDPTLNHPLFSRFQQLAHRLIFESECCQNLQIFCSHIQSNIVKAHWEVADLNWIRLESWRKVLKGIFNTQEKIEDLLQTQDIVLKYACKEEKSNCPKHYEIHYLHAWLAAQLQWTPQIYQSPTMTYQSQYGEVRVHIEPDATHQETDHGALTFLQLKTRSQKQITAYLDTHDSLIKIEVLDEKKPNEPYNTYLMHAKWEYTLSKEICYQETSTHYCNMLSVLSKVEGLI